MEKWGRVTIVAGTLAIMSALAIANPSVPWTPDSHTRHFLELLVDEAHLQLPLSQWPLPRAAVMSALDALPAELPDALDTARKAVRHALQSHTRSALAIALHTRAETLPGFGDDATPGSWVTLRSSVLENRFVALQLGGRYSRDDRPGASGSNLGLDDSAIVTEGLGIQLQAWSHRAWWGPGWHSSLVLGSNAPVFNGVGFQRASASRSESAWLSWMGPWNAEFFVAQSDDPQHAFFVGQRIVLRPFSNVEFGLTRTSQWGGRGHPQTPKSFVQMLLGTNVNTDSDDPMQDAANGLAGFDVRTRCPSSIRCSAYAQFIGEDQARAMPTKYLGLYGLEVWSADASQRLFAEFDETICGAALGHRPLRPCAYRNHTYPQGYTHGGRWIGASEGPDSRLFTIGWLDAEHGRTLRFHRGTIGSRIGEFSSVSFDPRTAGSLVGIVARQTFPVGPASLDLELGWLRVRALEGKVVEARIGTTLHVDLERSSSWLSDHWNSGRSTNDSTDWVRPLLMGAGLIAASTALDRPADDYARAHGRNPSARVLRKAGDAVPLIGMGMAGATWLAKRGTAQGDVALDAVESGFGAFALAEISKIIVNRSRPTTSLASPENGRDPRVRSSFPSIHAAVAWAVVTPYAQRYEMPWLYGAAALTNVGRVMSRNHWLSDTMGGALLGYFVADQIGRMHASGEDRVPRILLSPHGVAVHFTFDQ